MRLKENGVNVLGIGDCAYDALHPDLKAALTEYYKVGSLENYDEMVRAMGYFTFKYGKIDWLESNNEYWLEQDARLRTDFNITTGLKSDELHRFKYKSAMKEFYQKAGIPAARYHLISTLESARAFIDQVGYPVIVKPDNGVGAEATYRLKNDGDLEGFFADKPDVPYIMEEYVSGEVTTYDGVCNSQGEVLFATSHVTRNSIMDMVNEGVACYYYVNKEVPPEVERAGKATLKAFGAKSRAFHLEFFRLTEAKEHLGQVGDIVALEVNMRPAGGFTPDMINFANSVDLYQIWADMVAFDQCRHTYSGPKQYCVYCGRRDGVSYTHATQDINNVYSSSIRLETRMPDALAGTMGNQVYIATFQEMEQVDRFVRFAFEVK
ncbi:MAG: ATP-grasp domain-containing protein [Oscillospiraceae bacterium]|nr:ATP-grasp domain-containing protein [Oscillospiraceae bacterium]